MSEINDLLAKIAEPETPEERDEAWNEVANRLKQMNAMHKELNALCGWGDESFMHAYLHIGNVIKNLRADLSAEKILREKAETNHCTDWEAPDLDGPDGYQSPGDDAGYHKYL